MNLGMSNFTEASGGAGCHLSVIMAGSVFEQFLLA
jgi:hypothetical protein